MKKALTALVLMAAGCGFDNSDSKEQARKQVFETITPQALARADEFRNRCLSVIDSGKPDMGPDRLNYKAVGKRLFKFKDKKTYYPLFEDTCTCVELDNNSGTFCDYEQRFVGYEFDDRTKLQRGFYNGGDSTDGYTATLDIEPHSPVFTTVSTQNGVCRAETSKYNYDLPEQGTKDKVAVEKCSGFRRKVRASVQDILAWGKIREVCNIVFK